VTAAEGTSTTAPGRTLVEVQHRETALVGAGDDTIRGGAGSDTLNGGPGYDPPADRVDSLVGCEIVRRG
jgi:RTX calcium-binding nonapeptide repeat (4 copies)